MTSRTGKTAIDSNHLRELFDLSFGWAEVRDFKGYDPYDALTSPLLHLAAKALGRPAGIAATQVIKRLPVNIRPLLGIRRGTNPKALALFLSSAARTGRTEAVDALATRLLSLASRGYRHRCWGYPFPWYSRAFLLPAGTPTVVVTSFAGEALLDAYDATADSRYLDAALSACEFVLNSLNRTADETGVCLSYSPIDRTVVYNASVLGARLLVIAGTKSGRPELVEQARPLISYVLARQGDDGSWAYGEAGFHRWIDSFHTGFVLDALNEFATATGDDETAGAVVRGLAFYRRTFFGPGGEPLYHAGRRYPLDTHAAAQAVLTFLRTRSVDGSHEKRAVAAGRFIVDNMLHRSGRFLYQIRRCHTVRIPYMRWSQAWGVRALAELLGSRS